MRGFADLGDIPEDDRVAMIGSYVMAHPGVITGFVVDTAAIAARYLRKLALKYPHVEVIDQAPMNLGPNVTVTAVRVRKRADV